jgi:membrane-associated phospholipid phosphatase
MGILSTFKKLLPVLILMGVLFTACDNDNNDDVLNLDEVTVADFDHEVALKWNDLFLEIERYAAGYRPGPAPRALAYIGLASYEACAPGMKDHQSIASQYPNLKLPVANANQEYHWPSVVNALRANLMRRFFRTANNTLFEKITTLENNLASKYRTQSTEEIVSRSIAHGRAVADAMWEWSASDAVAHDAYLDPFKGYNWADFSNKPGHWRPTVPGPTQPMFAHWGRARTFAISESDKLCPPPLTFSETSTSAFFNQAMEVYAQTVNAPYENVWIAEFWSDDFVNVTFSPGPRWIAIANQVYDLEDTDLETALFCDAKVGLALNDAAVACWHSKYFYNLERPESYIKRVIDKNWEPILDNPITGDKGFSPPFPAYPSGHSTMGAAGAEALSSIFGYSYAMTDRCHENRSDFEGRPRTFGSFYEMAEENAWSRVPLGVHFRMDSEQGVNLGYRVARKVNRLPWNK